MGIFRKRKNEERNAPSPINNLFVENSGVITREYGKGRCLTVISEDQLMMGFRKDLRPSENVWMRLGKHFHHVGVISLDGNRAKITVSPLGNEETLGVGETVKFSTISSKVYDLKVMLESVSDGAARLVFQGIEEPVRS